MYFCMHGNKKMAEKIFFGGQAGNNLHSFFTIDEAMRHSATRENLQFMLSILNFEDLMIVNLTMMVCAIGRMIQTTHQFSTGSDTSEARLQAARDHPGTTRLDQVINHTVLVPNRSLFYDIREECGRADEPTFVQQNSP